MKQEISQLKAEVEALNKANDHLLTLLPEEERQKLMKATTPALEETE